MFDRYHFTQSPSDVHVHATVTEKRAPTDESVKLLREMEGKAVEQVLAAVRVENSQIACVLHYQRDHLSDVLHIRAILTINGTRVVADYRFYPGTPSDEIRAGLFDTIAREVCAHAFASAEFDCELMNYL